MKSLAMLRRTVSQGLGVVRCVPGFLEGLVYASCNKRVVGRVVYTSHIPCNGLEEPKSDEDLGVSVEVWFKRGKKKLVGFGQEPNDLTLSAVKLALEKAVRDAVHDSEFHGFLKPRDFPQGRLRRRGASARFLDLSVASEARLLARYGWGTIRGAVGRIRSYVGARRLSPGEARFILNGDTFLLGERMAVATSNGILESDESAVVLSFLTALLEGERAKGSAWEARNSLSGFSAGAAGARAAEAVIRGVGGVRVPSGRYNVVFGPQAVAELFGGLLVPHLSLGMIDLGASMFRGRYGKMVASPFLNVSDDGALPGGAGSKRVTCEGFPTGRTALIDRGKLVGFLADSRTMYKMLYKASEAKRKLGVDPRSIQRSLLPRNGFRFAKGGGRVASAPNGIYATNFIIESPHPVSDSALLAAVDNGLFIGRLWYTYPVGGYASGIISGTAIADCFEIRQGKLGRPLLLNTLRLEDHLGRMVQNILGIGRRRVPTILWASDEITHAPWVAMSGVNLVAINDSSSSQ